MTTEDKLRKIIEAQHRGGSNTWEGAMDDDMLLIGKSHYCMREGSICTKDKEEHFCHILEILLDPKGLRAAYPGKCCEDCSEGEKLFGSCPADGGHPWAVERAPNVGHEILTEWIASNGDAAATIDTAYDLLPK